MKTLYNITLTHRIKLATILSVFMVIMIVIDYWQTQKIQKIHTNFSSIYSDRLVPATELHFLANQLYDKQMLFGQVNNTQQPNNELLAQIKSKNSLIDSLLHEYEKTYFVAKEHQYLTHFKQTLSNQKSLENDIMLMDKGEVLPQEIQNKQRALFMALTSDLNDLAKVQTTVGQELIYESNLQFAGSQLIFNLRMILIIIVGVFAFVLAKSVKINKNLNQPFHLN
ncbi:MCP four helix bundle domain-containing protein [Fulvivirga sp.]|uniref:MCP four helix bundle domain-containing protein n=1 Tax=Fulvivirga sp. TaxID=1931237 RepID=UPI0032ED983D